MSNKNEEWNIPSDEMEKIKRRRKNTARRRKKKIAQLTCNLCMLALLVASVVLCIKYVIKPTDNNSNAASQKVHNTMSDNSKTAVKTSKATSDNEQQAANQNIIKYSFERPKAREGEEIRIRISELCKK